MRYTPEGGPNRCWLRTQGGCVLRQQNRLPVLSEKPVWAENRLPMGSLQHLKFISFLTEFIRV